MPLISARSTSRHSREWFEAISRRRATARRTVWAGAELVERLFMRSSAPKKSLISNIENFNFANIVNPAPQKVETDI
jgi:hypothetical protein